MSKPKLGISQGDPNGVGIEVILKTLRHKMILDVCIPILYANPKTINYQKKLFQIEGFSYNQIRDVKEAQEDQINLITTSNEAFEVKLGTPEKEAGAEALKALQAMLADAKAGKIDAMLTAPVDKSVIETEGGFTGHTSYLAKGLETNDTLMVLYSDDIKVGLITEHIPVSEISSKLNSELIVSKLKVASEALKRSFGIVKPKIAVLGLNPHNGDNGLLGKEEKDIIIPAIVKAKEEGVFCFGPYSADGFFGRAQQNQFDMVIAMYHDQGMVPFKAIAQGEGVNFTAGLPVVRTSPDHGTAYDIAGKNIASAYSFTNALFEAVHIYHRRNESDELKENPLGYSEFRRERFRLEQA